MTTPSSLSYEPCSCSLHGEETLHENGICIHCGRNPHVDGLAEIDSKGDDFRGQFRIARTRGTAKRAGGRPKRGKAPGSRAAVRDLAR